ncbi:MAG: hypothetical protein QM811_14895 [Pirellulales bacterium]
MKIAYPVAIDGEGKTWNAWNNRLWPSVYLIDKRGFARTWWSGELGDGERPRGDVFVREKIDALLEERD